VPNDCTVRRSAALPPLSPFSALSFGDNNNSSFEPVGKITGLVSIATRNRINSNTRDVVRANENLSTNKSVACASSYRMLDLNVGSESDLKIVKHSPGTGETTVDLVMGAFAVGWSESENLVVTLKLRLQCTISAWNRLLLN